MRPLRRSVPGSRCVFFAALLLATSSCSCTKLRGASDDSEGSCSMSAPTLYDKPVSNHGGRVRIIIYKKELEVGKDIVIKNPEEIGGHKSEAFLKLNPQGKFPLLVTEHGNIPESDTIARYMLDRFEDRGAKFIPSTLEGRTLSNHLCRLHDTYISPIQGCLYRPEPPFGRFAERSKAIAELKHQLQVATEPSAASAAVNVRSARQSLSLSHKRWKPSQSNRDIGLVP